MAVGVLLAVSLQGVIGGLRVLENSPDLAFLHGALAQAVFAFIGATAVYLSDGWRAAATPTADERAGGLRRLALATCGVVYGQAVLGAWFRHSAVKLALGLHVLVALAAAALVIGLSRRLGRARATPRGRARTPARSPG